MKDAACPGNVWNARMKAFGTNGLPFEFPDTGNEGSSSAATLTRQSALVSPFAGPYAPIAFSFQLGLLLFMSWATLLECSFSKKTEVSDLYPGVNIWVYIRGILPYGFPSTH